MADDIRAWLAGIGLGEYADAFIENGVDYALLPHLTNEDLKDLGIAKLGDRKKLLLAVQQVEFENSVPPRESAKPDAAAAARGDAERRQLTIMFVDLVGSTALSGRLDPEEMREAITAYQNTIAGVVTRFDGYIAKYMGDGVLCYFGWPRAHEDDAERAVTAGFAAMQALQSLTAPNGEPLSARAGVATGLVVVGDLIGEGAAQEEAVVGETPNLAARLQQLAAPGQVILADTTRRLMANTFDFTDLGEQALKGIEEPVRAFAVTGERLVETRFAARQNQQLAAMVGRDQELALLSERWRQAKIGEGQMVLLTGEAGIGKSRIVRGLIDALTAEDYVRVSYQCSPYHSDSPLYPAIQQLTLAAGFNADDAPEAKLDKLEALLRRGTEDISVATLLIASLLGLGEVVEARHGTLDYSPQQRRTRTLEALLGQLMGLARKSPVLVVLEDAHWVDPTTLEVMELCLDHIDTAPVMMLVTARPTFDHGFGGHPIVTRLALNKLGREQVSGIVERITRGKALPAELLELIAAKTDGVPLFIEEFTKTLLEFDFLTEADGHYILTDSLQKLSIPTSLHDSLMARLDRLQPIKEVAQTAACIGRVFDYSTLHAILPLADHDLVAALDQLREAELVFGKGVPPDATYTFKHALVRDAAYESLLRARRQDIHARLVTALEHSGAGSPEILAHHATEAGFIEKAIQYWQQAGQGAMSRSANREAIGHLTNAISLTRSFGEDRQWREKELELQVLLGQALIANQGYAGDKTAAAFDQALALAEEIGDTPYLMPALFGQWSGQYVRGGPTPELEQGFLKVANAGKDSGPRVVSLRILALGEFHRGDFVQADAFLEQALQSYRPHEHHTLALKFGHDPRSAALNYKSWLLWFFGYPEQSAAASREALAWATEINHVNTTGLVMCWGRALPNALQRKARETEDMASRALELANEHALLLWRGYAQAFRGWARVARRDDDGGLAEMAEGLNTLDQTGAGRFRPLLLALYAEAQLTTDRPELAADSIASAFEWMEKSQDVAWEADLHRVQADIRSRLAPGDVEAIEADCRRGLAVARHRGDKSSELRLALSLARTWAAQGRGSDARDMVGPLYEGFTEGFETPDLKDAKALLDDLA